MAEPRVVVVTGGGSGIGRATARRFAAGGDRVVVADIDAAGGARVVAQIEAAGGAAEYRHVDVAEEASVAALCDGVHADHGAAGVLVNSAGILQNVSAIATFDLAEHDRVWAINYRGTYLCCRAFATRMPGAGGGCIVNISSTSSHRSFPLHAYGPGKAAIDRLTSILAAELGEHGIRVNAVVPGYVLTEQMQARIDAGKRDPQMMYDQAALGRMVAPEEIADGIWFLCSDAARAITGISMPIDAGWLATVDYRQHPGFSPKLAGG